MKNSFFFLHLMTDKAHHCAFFHRVHKSHFFTFDISTAKFFGSDFIISSNSANFPGRKKTFVKPNLKSESRRFNALNKHLQKSRGSSRANSFGKYDLYIAYNSANGVRDGKPCCIRSNTETMPNERKKNDFYSNRKQEVSLPLTATLQLT